MSEANFNSNNVNPINNEQPQEPQGWGAKIYRMIFIFIIFSWVSKLLKPGKSPAQNDYTLKNILKINTEFNINFYIGKGITPMKHGEVINNLLPVLTLKNIKYTSEGNSSFIIENEVKYSIDTSILNDTDASKLKEEKLYLYSDIVFSEEEVNKKYLKIFYEYDAPFFQSINILKFTDSLNEIIKQKDFMNDLELGELQHDSINADLNDNTTELNGTVSRKKNYVKNLYYKPEIMLYLLSMENEAEISSFEELRILGTPSKFNFAKKVFAPYTYLTDFWTMNSDLKPIDKLDNNTAKLKIKIDFKFITMFYFKNMKGVEINSDMMENTFHIPASKDMFVELLKNNSMTYLIIMFTVNILHSVFSFLGFASDVSYYKNLKQLDGVYTKHLFFNMFQMFVTILYVSIEGSHFIVKIELAVGLAIELWKLKKIFLVELKPAFPFISINYKIEFKLKKSKDYETESVNLMLKYIFVPIAIFYLGYRIYYYKQSLEISLFKFVIEYVFFLMNLFGFVLLTPQIFLNYKLKSVQHMPFKALTFKFLNTIIDDLYAFAVKTPTLYRIFCFKDDVIFVIFIYQIIKYRKNKRLVASAEEMDETEEVAVIQENKEKSD